MVHLFLRRIVPLLLAAFVVLFGAVAEASHFRFGNITWSIPDPVGAPRTVRFVVTIIIDAGTRISDRSTPCVPGKALVAVGRGRFWNATWIIRGHRTGIRAAVLILAGGYHIIALAASHREDHGKDRDHQRIPEETRLSGCVHGRPKVS